jgi:hypothetical protein
MQQVEQKENQEHGTAEMEMEEAEESKEEKWKRK